MRLRNKKNICTYINVNFNISHNHTTISESHWTDPKSICRVFVHPPGALSDACLHLIIANYIYKMFHIHNTMCVAPPFPFWCITIYGKRDIVGTSQLCIYLSSNKLLFSFPFAIDEARAVREIDIIGTCFVFVIVAHDICRYNCFWVMMQQQLCVKAWRLVDDIERYANCLAVSEWVCVMVMWRSFF